MNIELQELNATCGGVNPAGNTLFELTPIEWVKKDSDVNMIENKLLSPIVLNASRTWLTMPFRPESLKLDEQLNPDVQNGVYLNVIEFDIPSETDSMSVQMEQYRRHLFVVKMKDKAGLTKIIGSKNSPCSFKYSYTSGKKTSDFKGYKVQIQQLSKSKSPTYPF